MKMAEVPPSFGASGCVELTSYDTDPDDVSCYGEAPELLEKRRKLHTEAEQRRRNAIKVFLEVRPSITGEL